EGPKDDQFFMGYGTFIYASMASAFVVETERWDAAQKLFEPLQSNPAVSSLAGKPGPYQSLAQYIQALGIFTRGLAAAQKGSSDAQKGIDELQALVQQAGKEPLPGVGVPLSQVLEIQTLEMDAVSNAAKDNMDESIKNMEKAITLEESFPPLPGPPPLIKPSHVLFGEILLRAKRPKEAAAQFATSLRRHKNRARSLLGVARAAASDKEREDVRARVLEMGGTVEEHLTTALEALADGNPGLAELAASNDYKVNTMEIDIDADCTAILARRQPAAGDLRLVLAMTRITTDLERIGDEAKKIARVVLRLTESEGPKAYYIGVLNMGGRVRKNLRAALDALARMDSRAALQVAREDSLVDQEYDAIMRQLITYMMEDPRSITRVLDTAWAVRALERIGDHANNICESVIYLVDGKDIRHLSYEDLDEEPGDGGSG
ncbi:MAG: phosphate signaling complex protein PhoU, partial [Gammaproteobacteria bacterium]